MTAPVITTQGLTKCFGDTPALDGLDLEVPPGVVFGYLGPNGAGKSTTIRMLVGLMNPSSGCATVLGHDVVRNRRALHREIGYLPGDFAAYRDLTAEQYLAYLANLRGDVTTEEIQVLAERFDLDLARRIGTMSHGNRQKVGIIQACMHRPRLLVLDEPTSGLDPIMQHQFLDLIREFRDRGSTVFLSSHVLNEVEAVADLVAIIRSGRLAVVSAIGELKSRARRRVELTFTGPAEGPIAELSSLPSVVELDVSDRVVALTVEGSMAELMRVAAPFGIDRVVSNEVDLEDVFMRYYNSAGR